MEVKMWNITQHIRLTPQTENRLKKQVESALVSPTELHRVLARGSSFC